jgi:hypothetical protein
MLAMATAKKEIGMQRYVAHIALTHTCQPLQQTGRSCADVKL